MEWILDTNGFLINNPQLNYTAPQSGNPVDQDLDGGFPASGRYQDNLPEGGVF